MAEIINLRQARKAKRRADAAEVAASNRARHGRTRAEREREDMEQTRARTELDGKKISEDPGSAR